MATAVLLVSLGALCVALEACCATRQHVVYNIASSLGIVLVFYEYVRALHGLARVPWPLGQERSVARLELGLSDALSYLLPASTDCLVGEAFAGRRAVLACAPLAALAALALLRVLAAGAAVVLRVGSRYCSRFGDGREALVTRDTVVNVLGLLTSACMGPLVSSSFSFFQCYEHPGTDGSWMSLRWSPEVLCVFDPEASWLWAAVPGTNPDAWQRALPIGVLGLAYPAAWLTLQVVLLRRLPAALLANHGSGRSKGFLARHRYAWRRLRENSHFWDLMAFSRMSVLHLVLTLEPLGFPVWGQLFVLFLVNLLALVGLVLYMPYTELSVNVLEGCTSGALLLILASGILILNEVEASSQNTITSVMIIAILIYTAYVMFFACKDLLFPKGASATELEDITDFVVQLSHIATAGCEIETGVLVGLMQELDMQSIRSAQQSLHYLEQMMMPSSGHRATKWTRLATFEGHTEELDEELESNFREHGSVQAASMAHNSQTAGIVAVLAGNTSSIGGEGGLVSARRSRDASRGTRRLAKRMNSLFSERPGSACLAERSFADAPRQSPPEGSDEGNVERAARDSYRGSDMGSVLSSQDTGDVASVTSGAQGSGDGSGEGDKAFHERASASSAYEVVV